MLYDQSLNMTIWCFMRIETYGAAEFKTNCLSILDRLAHNDVDKVTVTKRGKVVAILTPPPCEAQAVNDIHGFMRTSVSIPDDIDLTAPVLDEPVLIERGILHQ